MRLTIFISLLLALSVSALDDVALAKNRIDVLQRSCVIDWKNPPSSDGKRLNRNMDSTVTVYIERHVDKSYINTGVSDDVFSLTKSTTVLKDITEGSAVSAQSSTGSGLAAIFSFTISKGSSRTDHTSKSNGSVQTKILTRQETCEAGHACRFETWTYYVQIKGTCGGSPCEIRTPIMGPDEKPMTAVIYIPQELPTGISAIQERLEAELARDYCIDWSKPPRREGFHQRIEPSLTVYRPRAKLLNKFHNITVHAKRVAEPGQASTHDSDSTLYFEQSTIAIDSSTEGWSVGAHTSSSFGLAIQLPSPLSSLGASGSVQFSDSKSEDKSRQETDGKWISDGFSISSTCKSGHYCTFETWTFYAHFSGICQNTQNPPLQRRCEFDVPIFNRAGKPYTHFVKVSQDLSSANDKGGQPNGDKANSSDKKGKVEPSSGDNKPPKALGAIENLCMLDNYEYWGIRQKKYLDYEKDAWAKDPNRPEPENLENCDDPLPQEPKEAGIKCYTNEIWAASLPEKKTEIPEKVEEKAPNANGKAIVDSAGRKWCQLDNDQWYNPDTDRYWEEGVEDGVAKPDVPKPKDLDKCNSAPKANGKAIVDTAGRKWCPLDDGQWYNLDTHRYWKEGVEDGVEKPDAPKPEGLDKCTGTAASVSNEEQQAAKATGEVKQDRQGRNWCVLDNGEWYDKDKDEYLIEDDQPGVPKPNQPKPQNLDQCKTPEKQGDSCQTATSVKVTFRLTQPTTFGQTIKIVGNTDVLGNWDTSKAIALDASEYEHPHKPMWKGDVTLPAGQAIEYKYIRVEQDGRLAWEADPNHAYEVPRTCDTTAEQVDEWHK